MSTFNSTLKYHPRMTKDTNRILEISATTVKINSQFITSNPENKSMWSVQLQSPVSLQHTATDLTVALHLSLSSLINLFHMQRKTRCLCSNKLACIKGMMLDWGWGWGWQRGACTAPELGTGTQAALQPASKRQVHKGFRPQQAEANVAAITEGAMLPKDCPCRQWTLEHLASRCRQWTLEHLASRWPNCYFCEVVPMVVCIARRLTGPGTWGLARPPGRCNADRMTMEDRGEVVVARCRPILGIGMLPDRNNFQYEAVQCQLTTYLSYAAAVVIVTSLLGVGLLPVPNELQLSYQVADGGA
ncbi:uncharacterized protein PSFLO_06874 [Pseudozyma flocculosa]|uniref:Uncharacterized protein n=1 Tax=Pseudozyma flocculosa TaxID=84751 RepID=A0A5C3FAG8_9BASI|nr:uncharacterized protein PSFLO_06874 [Pseudozyma flocculosa]